MSDEEMAFDNEMLKQFHQEFIQHCEEYHIRIAQEDRRFNKLLEAQEKNTDDIRKLIGETRAIVQLHGDLESARRIGVSVQKFGLWLVRWPVIGLGLYSIWKWIVYNLPK